MYSFGATVVQIFSRKHPQYSLSELKEVITSMGEKYFGGKEEDQGFVKEDRDKLVHVLLDCIKYDGITHVDQLRSSADQVQQRLTDIMQHRFGDEESQLDRLEKIEASPLLFSSPSTPNKIISPGSGTVPMQLHLPPL